MKKKVLRILNRFSVGGPVYNAVYLTKYLDIDKYETLLIGGTHENHEASARYILDRESLKYKELECMKKSISLYYDFLSFFKILSIMYNYKPDIIHTHASKAGLLGRIASLFYFKDVKVVHTYHGNVFEGYYNKFINKFILIVERFLARNTDKIIAISKSQKNELINKYLICKEDKIEIVSLGFDLEKFTINQKEKRKEKRRELKINNNEILITIIGRVVKIKNHRFFIDVFNYCKSNSKIPLKALIVGDGPELDNLLEYTSKKDLIATYKHIESDYDIFFTSWRDDIDYLLAASDIVTLTSINEGTPVSIIESMASGTASISTNVGGVSDIIKNYKTGIVSKSSLKYFGNDLLNLINDSKLRENLGARSMLSSNEKFNYKVLIQNIEKLYESLYDKR